MSKTSPTQRLGGYLSTIFSRQLFSNRAGITYEGQRDLFLSLGYKRILTLQDYRDRYSRGGIAERICEAHPRATWSGGARIIEGKAIPEDTPFEVATAELFERLDLWQRLLRSDILAGLGRYGVLFIGAPTEGTDADALRQELPKMKSQDEIFYVTPLGEDHSTIGELEMDPGNKRFGLPKFYSCTFGPGLTRQVHWSRIIHVAEGLLSDDIYGKPRLRAVWNNMDDLEKIVGGGAEAAWKRMDPGMHLDMDPEMELDAEEESKFNDEVKDYQHNLSRVIRTRGVDLKLLASSVQSFRPNSEAILMLISATSGIPYRILTGSERGELASTQDRNNWNDRVVERRREFAGPLVARLLNRLMEYGALPKVDSFNVSWVELDEIADDVKAEMIERIAKANKAQFESEGTVIMKSNEVREELLGLPPLPEPEPLKPPDAPPATPDEPPPEDDNDTD